MIMKKESKNDYEEYYKLVKKSKEIYEELLSRNNMSSYLGLKNIEKYLNKEEEVFYFDYLATNTHWSRKMRTEDFLEKHKKLLTREDLYSIIKQKIINELEEVETLTSYKSIIKTIQKWENNINKEFDIVGPLQKIEEIVKNNPQILKYGKLSEQQENQEVLEVLDMVEVFYDDAYKYGIDIGSSRWVDGKWESHQGYYQNLYLKIFDAIDDYLIDEYFNDENFYIDTDDSVFKSFNPIEGGETTLYYLRLSFRGKRYYKIGVTLGSVKSRYTSKDFETIDKVLYEKQLTHANTIEKQIIKKFQDKVFPLSILSSGQTEIFDEDILKMDI